MMLVLAAPDFGTFMVRKRVKSYYVGTEQGRALSTADASRLIAKTRWDALSWYTFDLSETANRVRLVGPFNRSTRGQTLLESASGGRSMQQLQEQLETAFRLHQAGNRERAEPLYRGILAQEPHNVNALHLLGMLLHERCHDDEALPLVRRAVGLRPHEGTLHNSLGVLRLALGRLDEAEQCHEQCSRRRPDHAPTYLCLARIALQKGEPQKAETRFREALTHDPANSEAFLGLANVLRSQLKLEEAVDILREAVTANPGFVAAMFELGCLQQRLNRPDEAEKSLGTVLEARPEHCEALFALAKLHERQGEIEKTVAHCVRAIKANEAFAPAHLLLGLVLASRMSPEHRARLDLPERAEFADKALLHLRRAMTLRPSAETVAALGNGLLWAGRHREAIETYQRALAFNDCYAPAYQGVGRAYLEMGQIDEALRQLHQAVTLDPRRVEARYELSRIERARDLEFEIRQLRELLEEGDLSLRDEMLGRFALAHRLDEQGDHDSAFAQFLAANRLKDDLPRRRGQPHAQQRSAENSDQMIQRQINLFDAPFVQGRKGWGSESELPVFIVGMPRSGTTLVEQILASHPQIHGAGELSDISDLAISLPRRLGSNERYPDVVKALTKSMADELAGKYLAQLRKRSHTALRITDKMPTNFRQLGFISLLLPRARLVHMIRDPRDVCVSCVKQNLEWPFSDLEAVGRYYRAYERLMRHWKAVLPPAMLDVHYEQLVADPRTESQRMIDFCGLPWDDRCLDFAASDRAVQTPSKWQVRQPIYRSSVGSWKKYAAHLQPLNDALADS